jgi:hypothetical protein
VTYTILSADPEGLTEGGKENETDMKNVRNQTEET